MDDLPPPRRIGAFASLRYHLWHDPLGLSGSTVLTVMVVLALGAPLLAPYPVGSQDLSRRFDVPSALHPLGLDELGRDIASRLIFGARISLFLSFVVVSSSTLVGLTLGTVAGFAGGWVDDVIMRGVDILMAFPSILLAISLVAVLGPGEGNLVLALCLIGWVGYARLARAQILKTRQMEYVFSARAAGARWDRILLFHLLPNISGPIIVQATVGMAGVILSEAGLSFLGLGLPPPQASWGSMLRSGSQHLFDAPHLILYPGTAIMLAVLSFNFLGDSIRDWLDPRLDRGLGPGRG